MATPVNAEISTARSDLENTLRKAVKSKAIDYMRPAVANYDSQEIIIQVTTSAGGYNFDSLLAEPGLLDRVVNDAWTSDDYLNATVAAAQRSAEGKTQPIVKKPDRIAFYDSTGKLIYSK